MKSRRSFTFLIIGIAVLGGLLLVWSRAAMTWQEQSSARSQPTPTIDEYQPKSTLITGEHKIERAKFPFIDIHSHHWNPTAGEVDELAKEMDTKHLRVEGDLSGGTGEQPKNNVAAGKGA